MIDFRRTSQMEPTALLLDKRFDRVMIRAACAMEPAIRLRWKMLSGIRPFLLRNGAEFDGEITRWQEQDGTLINNRQYTRGEAVLRHDATLLCECPMAWDGVEAASRDAAKLCVVYRPPSWKTHEASLHAWWPSGVACRRFAEAVKNNSPRDPIGCNHILGTAAQLGMPESGMLGVSDDAICAAMKINEGELHALRKRTMRVVNSRKKYSHRFSLVLQLIPRIEPEDITLLPLYRQIADDLPAVGHIRLARDNVLSKSHRFWKTTLRALVRSGSVEKKPTLGYYFFDCVEPDYDRIQAEHVAAKGKFERMVKQVDGLEDFK